jgi:hypothetical protein
VVVVVIVVVVVVVVMVVVVMVVVVIVVVVVTIEMVRGRRVPSERGRKALLPSQRRRLPQLLLPFLSLFIYLLHTPYSHPTATT